MSHRQPLVLDLSVAIYYRGKDDLIECNNIELMENNSILLLDRMGVQKKKSLDSYGADDEDGNDLDQLAAPVKNIEVN
jgi:hypothetical protein